NHYLTRFSRLMRSILNMSDKDEISLTQEIDALKWYLELEALRLNEDFEYTIDMDPEIQPATVYLPSMLIQPYVENAIKHGLLHRKGDKKLYIRFRKEESYLICEVEDNGIGRERAREIRQKYRQQGESRAMSLTQERLFLLNSASKGKLNVEITDHKNQVGKASGTLVKIFIQHPIR
ncbi:MAG: histidine kinase, partial [Bacteroidota bacterium]